MGKENKEAIKMKVFILHSMITLYDENDSIWREIIRRTKRLEVLRGFPEFENIPFEAPFLQGDITGNESGLPDVIYESKRYVLGIEHFEFDSSCQTRKGSKMKQDSFKAETELDKLQRTIQSRPSKIEINVPTEFSYKHYLKSLFSTFKSHIEKVDKYKRALKKKFPGKTVLIAFFIEDSTELGNYVITPKDTKGLNPLYLKL